MQPAATLETPLRGGDSVGVFDAAIAAAPPRPLWLLHRSVVNVFLVAHSFPFAVSTSPAIGTVVGAHLIARVRTLSFCCHVVGAAALEYP